MRDTFKTTDCIFGVLYANKQSFLEEAVESQSSLNRKLRIVGDLGKNKRASKTLDISQQKRIFEGVDYNLRGINTFNLFKRVVWSCVTDLNEDNDLDDNSQVNLPLLKGLLNEIHSEIYIEDYCQKIKKNNKYKKINIHDCIGFDDFALVDDHADISKQVQQIVLIDPSTIIKAFKMYRPFALDAEILSSAQSVVASSDMNPNLKTQQTFCKSQSTTLYRSNTINGNNGKES